MGQSRRRLLKMMAAHPFCAFCGGTEPTTSIEHMPSRILFDYKQRPRGLEFPSCQPCQATSRKAELVVAMLARLYPDPTGERQRLETAEIIRAANHNNPGLLAEVQADQISTLHRLGAKAFKLPTWGFSSLSGPICQNAIMLVGKKLALALHYEQTGRVVPKGGHVYIEQFTNVDVLAGDFPDSFASFLGPDQTLRMGQQQVSEQFSYRSTKVVDGAASAHMAYFRQSFALAMAVFPDVSEVPSSELNGLQVV